MTDVSSISVDQINLGCFLCGIFVGFVSSLIAGVIVSLSDYLFEKASILRERKKK